METPTLITRQLDTLTAANNNKTGENKLRFQAITKTSPRLALSVTSNNSGNHFDVTMAVIL